jgi:hypothetical protein
VLAKYAYQSLYVKHPEYYLSASLNSSVVRNLAASLNSEIEIFEWIRTHIRYGSIFNNGEERLMTADQVLVFQQGSYKDQAVLAFTLLRHLGISSVTKSWNQLLVLKFHEWREIIHSTRY